MKVTALVCSARQRGNCYNIAEIMLNHLKVKSVETEILNAYDYEITPCSHCSYECFKSPRNCPIQDDIPRIWKKLKEADGVVFAIPTYYGMPSALFKAVIEREQGILDWISPEFRDLDSLWKGKTVAMIIVSNGGGDSVKNMVLEYFPSQTKIVAEVFSYRKYGTAGYKGDLAQNTQVISRAKHLADNMYQLLKQERGRSV